MVKIESFSQMLQELQKERGLSKELIVQAIKAALLSAAKKSFKNSDNLEVEIDDSGQARIIAKKTVVKSVDDAETQILLKEAKKIDPKAKVGSEVRVDVTPSDFGRMAAQTAKQVIIQRIREAEKDTTFDEFSKKVGDILNGIVQRREYTGYLVNLGRTETLLPNAEVIPGETFRPKDRIKVYVVEVKKTPRGPLIVISRTHSGLVKKLLNWKSQRLPKEFLKSRASRGSRVVAPKLLSSPMIRMWGRLAPAWGQWVPASRILPANSGRNGWILLNGTKTPRSILPTRWRRLKLPRWN